jgi:hypothetical protein
MADFESLKVELIRAMNEQSFIYIGEGLTEVTSFINNFMDVRGFKFDTLHVEEIPQSRRRLRIYCRDKEFLRGSNIWITIHNEQY